MTDDFKYWNIHRDNSIQLPVVDLETKKTPFSIQTSYEHDVYNKTEQHYCISQDIFKNKLHFFEEDLGFQEGGGVVLIDVNKDDNAFGEAE